jgi:two-component system, cell cycle sensor histidine kinase and response regulator CckA
MHFAIVPRFRKSASPFALGILALAVVVALSYRFHLNAAIVVPLCVLITVLQSRADGFTSSAILSILAAACLDYFFIPPAFSFRIHDPVNVVALLGFLAITNTLAWLVWQEHEALRDSKRYLALAQSAVQLGVWSYDLRTKLMVASREFFRLHGLETDRTSLTGEEWFGLVHPDDQARVRELSAESLTRTHAWDTEFRVLWPDGSVHWLLVKGSVLLDDAARPIRMAGVNLDITERKQAEAALKESEERFRNVAHSAPVGIWETGPDGRVSFYNSNALRFLGTTMQQIEGTSGMQQIHPDDRERVQTGFLSAFADRRRCEVECRLRRSDEEYRWVLCSGVPRFDGNDVFRGYIGSFVDITDIKMAQEEALGHRTLESLGRMAGGIAHDFNNLLGGILASAELALTEAEDGSAIDEELKRIRGASIRGGEIVRQLMTYGGAENAAFEPVDAPLVVQEMLQLLKVSISKHAVFETELGEDILPVEANPAQLRQVLMNLLINASEAIGERTGVIRVAVTQVKVGPDSHGGRAPNLKEGDYVQIAVSDTGSGMSPQVQARVFDPFYTTKFAGRGLGLAVTQGIVRRHRGAIHFVSELGQGTTFHVWLPCAPSPVQAIRSSISLAVARRSALLVGTILVVEDEDTLRIAVSKGLRKRGLSVIEASDGSAAMDLIRAQKDDIDAVLLDVTIPGVASRDVFEDAKRMRPDLKVILTSAYGREVVDASFSGLRVEYFIRKPFQLADLASLLQDALSS